MRVWAGARSTTTAKTFDDFRVEIYSSGSAGIDVLPPTSRGIRGHIQQGAFSGTWMEGALWHTPAIKMSEALTTKSAHSM